MKTPEAQADALQSASLDSITRRLADANGHEDVFAGMAASKVEQRIPSYDAARKLFEAYSGKGTLKRSLFSASTDVLRLSTNLDDPKKRIRHTASANQAPLWISATILFAVLAAVIAKGVGLLG